MTIRPPEGALVVEAKRALFKAQMAELLALAVEIFRDAEITIDKFGIRHCTRCGSPILVGPAADVKLPECEEHGE